MSECVFCQIARGEMGTELVWQDDEFVAFKDLAPKAAQHVLVIPRRHVESLAAFEGTAPAEAGRFVLAALAVARRLGLLAPGKGFRLIANTGPEGGQSVGHVHLHVLGGQALHWTPA
jgi:histidine triad (HIT) family protein